MVSRSPDSAAAGAVLHGRRRVRLSLRGGAFAGFAGLSLVAAYIAGWAELLVVACFAAVPPVAALAVLASRRVALAVVRVVSPRVLSARGVGVVRLLVRNRGSRAVPPGEWWDRLPWDPGASGVEALPGLGVDRVTEVRYGLVPPRRGVVDVGPFVARFIDPFGLAVAECTFGRPERVVVAPELVPLTSGVVEIAAQRGSARLFQHRALAGEHDVMTREYRSGDALRRVHWRSSARHGELMVREDERRSHASAVVLVETRARGFADLEGARSRHPFSASFEWSLSMVASLREHLVAHGLAVTVAETTQPQLADAMSGADFVESLARVQLSFDDFRRPRWRDDARGLGSVFAVLGLLDAELVEELTLSRHLFDSAVAFVSRVSRDALIESLLRAGWSVVTVEPEDAVADAWLRVGDD